MTAYEPVSWTDDELITADKLNKMTTNDKYLSEQVIVQQYNAYNIVKTDGLRILTGIVGLPASTNRQISKEIGFGSFFTIGCRPSVQATLATIDQYRSFVAIKGLGVNNLRPDHTGFQVVINADPLAATKKYFPTTVHVHWMAIGY